MKKLRRSVLMSAVSLVLCLSLFAGMTYAWFTDEIVIDDNLISSGNLDVELWQKTVTLNEAQKAELGVSLTDAEYTDISELKSKIFADGVVWEPGYSTGATLKVKNAGSLGLKYELVFLNISSIGDVDLATQLEIYVLDEARVPTATDVALGTLAELSAAGNGKAVFATGVLGSTSESEPVNVVVKMKESAGNEYIGASVTFDVRLYATQATLEENGFGDNGYDEEAGADISSTTVIVPVETEGVTVLVNDESATKVEVPYAAVAEGADTITLKVEETDKDGGITVNYNQASVGYDITLDGIKDAQTNTAEIKVTIQLEKGLTGVELYHYDVKVDSAQYDAASGLLTFTATSFSPYTVVYDTRGTASDPYIITDAEQLKAIVSLTGDVYLRLANDVILTDTVLPMSTSGDTYIDLNGYTLRNEYLYETSVKDGNGLYISNGTLEMLAEATNYSTISVYEGSVVQLEGVVYNSTGSALYPSGNAANVTVKDSTINAVGYCIATNANVVEHYDVDINVENSTLNGSDSGAGTAVIINVPCTVNITGSTINGYFHGIILRGGTATITDSFINNTVEGDSLLHYFDTRNWGSGNTVNLAALTLGNKLPGSYQYPTSCTLVNTGINSYGVYPAVYAYGNEGEGLGVNIDWDDATLKNINGDIVIGNDAVTYNAFNGSGTEADPYAIVNGWQMSQIADYAVSGNGVYFKIVEDIDFVDQVWLTEGKVNIDVEDGKTVTVFDEGIFDILGTAELTINGGFYNQTWDSNEGYLFRAGGGSRLVINDGRFVSGLTCVQAGENSVAEIHGGRFETLADWNNSYWHLNLVDNTEAKIIVYGGEFVNFDPSHSKTENPVADFTAEGTTVTSEVIAGTKVYTVTKNA